MTDIVHSAPAAAHRGVAIAIFVLVGLYAVTATQGWPQQATQRAVASASHDHDAHHADPARKEPPLYTVAPFVLLLGAIAVFPLAPKLAHWWEWNWNRFLVAGGLGVLTLLYYALLHQGIVERHFIDHAVIERAGGFFDFALPWTVFQNAIFNEFVPFIVLLFSLYVISGGIRISGDLPAHSLTNTCFLAIGGLLASFIGTTGAAMLLIRPLLETNSERKHVRHTVIFFIFIVCNCGGCLLPIGDPPLFLGYLQGVDFLWTAKALWKEWLIVNAALLAVYFVWDHFFAYPKEALPDIQRDETQVRRLTFGGVWLNGVLLFGVVLAVALLDPVKGIPGTDLHPWLYLREMVQLALVGVSLLAGSPRVREENRFNYDAILEVAALFFGIFLCMQPALAILNVRGPALGLNTPQEFFWATGGLSSFLDNAPTYLVFFETARTLPAGGATMGGVDVHLLAAISLGAVFMGAMTYIGNGPNFMVKSIAERSGVQMPSFFGYVGYSCAILLPLFLLLSLFLL